MRAPFPGAGVPPWNCVRLLPPCVSPDPLAKPPRSFGRAVVRFLGWNPWAASTLWNRPLSFAHRYMAVLGPASRRAVDRVLCGYSVVWLSHRLAKPITRVQIPVPASRSTQTTAGSASPSVTRGSTTPPECRTLPVQDGTFPSERVGVYGRTRVFTNRWKGLGFGPPHGPNQSSRGSAGRRRSAREVR